MGCCSTSTLDDGKDYDENSALLSTSRIGSIYEYDRSYESLAQRPDCKCGENLNPYELQCCYLQDNGDLSTASINCELCGKSMHDPTDIVWHCLASHAFTYDLCHECGLQQQQRKIQSTSTSTIVNQNKQIEEKLDASQDFRFDPKYNTLHINWNKLYDIIADAAKQFKVNKLLKNNLDLNNLQQYNFPAHLLEFIEANKKATITAQAVHDAANDTQGWTQQSDSDGIVISYKKEEDAVYYSIKADFVAEASILDFVSALNEFDLLGELVKLVKVETQIFKEFTNCHKVVYMRTSLYWPLKDIDFIMEVQGCDALEELDEVILWGCSPKDDYIVGVEIPSVAECGTMRVEIVRLDCVCKPIRFGVRNKKDRTRIIMIYNVNFRIYLPQKVINWVLRTLSSILVRVLKHTCENMKGTKHEKRMDSKEIYKKWRLGCMRAKQRRAKKGITSPLTNTTVQI